MFPANYVTLNGTKSFAPRTVSHRRHHAHIRHSPYWELLSLCSVLHAQATDVKTQTRTLLDAYAREDQKTVLASIDDQTVMYGSDATEVFHGVASIQAMLANDARLWSGTAHIGEMQNITVVKQGNFESIFFQAPFTVGNRSPVPSASA